MASDETKKNKTEEATVANGWSGELSALKVDPKFDRLTPATEEGLRALENAILEDGEVQDPIKVWKDQGIVVDGHSRLAILKKHPDLPYSVRELPFENWEAVQAWIVERHIARKSFNLFQKLEMAITCEDYWKTKAEAKARQGTRNDLLPEDGKKSQAIDIAQVIAEKVGCSRSMVTNFKRVYTESPEGVKNKCRQGDMSITRAYNDLAKKNKKPENKSESHPATPTMVTEDGNIFDECEHDIDVGKKNTVSPNGTPCDVRSLVDEVEQSEIPDGAIWLVLNKEHSQMQVVKKSVDVERGSTHIKVNSFNCRLVSAKDGRIVFEADHINGGVQLSIRKDKTEFETVTGQGEV
jgi:hypothetical protein